MPNRVIKESIKRSPQIDSLTWFEEVIFYRLIVTADDYGCIDGRPVLIKNELFLTRENVTRKSIEDAIAKLVAVGLLYQYEVDGRPYLAFPTWEKHQRIRNKHRKYPEPPDGFHLTANCCQSSADCNAESESESNPNPNKGVVRFAPPTIEEIRDYCAEHGYAVDPERFHAYYQSNGWMVGKNKMRDWRAAVRNWNSRDAGQPSGKMCQSSAGKKQINPPTPETLSEIEQNAIRKMLEEQT